MDRFLTRTLSTSSIAAKRPAEDDNDWLQPKKTLRPATTLKAPQVNITNRFSNLPNEDAGSANDVSGHRSPSFLPKKIDRIPPIFIDILPEWTHESIKNIISKYSSSYHLKYRGENRVAVYCDAAEAHQLVKDGLRNDNIAFHTFSRKDERPYKVVIRGLPPLIEDDAKAELSALGYPDVGISKLRRNQETTNLSYSPLYLAILPAGSDINQFRKIKRLCHCVVQLEKFKTRSAQCTQCYRCQKFGHASRNCNLSPRCVKCLEQHETKDCPKTDKSTPAFCCNCNEQHPANYTKCSERLKYIENLKKKNTVTQPPRNTMSSQVDTRSWASVAATNKPLLGLGGSTRPVKPAHTPTGGNIDDSMIEMLNILCVIKSLKSKFLNCPTLMDKVILILSEMGQYV